MAEMEAMFFRRAEGPVFPGGRLSHSLCRKRKEARTPRETGAEPLTTWATQTVVHFVL